MKQPEKDPKNYKWGFFYYNPRDERLFVLKPDPGMGVTMNFAHKKAGIWTLGIIGFFGFIFFMISAKRG